MVQASEKNVPVNIKEMAHPCATPDNEAWNQPGAEFNQQALAAATGDLAWYDQTEVSGHTEHTFLFLLGEATSNQSMSVGFPGRNAQCVQLQHWRPCCSYH